MLIGNACSNERTGSTYERLHGGEAGNQRKLKERFEGITDFSINDELRVEGWRNLNENSTSNTDPRKLWAVLRFKEPKYRQKMAQAMINACMNPFVGYDQDTRTSFRTQVAMMGYSVESLSAVKTVCACDCSSLVSLCFYCVTGKDIGDRHTADLDTAILNTGLCESVFIDGLMESKGVGTMPGDICVWKNSQGGYGHATVVVSYKDDVSISYNQANMPWLSGVTGVVIVGEDKIYGQDQKTSIANSTKAFRIYSLDKKDNLQEINKVIVVDKYGNPNFIYGYAKLNFAFNMIGDSRTVQLGSVSLERNTDRNALLYGFLPDQNIFAWWGCNLVDQRPHYISRTTYAVKGIVSKSSYTDREGVFTLWLKNGDDQKAFNVVTATTALDVENYTGENALSGKMVTIEGYVEYQDGLYLMPTYDKFFSPDPDNYSCPTITKIETANSSTSTANTIDQIITIMENRNNTYSKFSLTQKAKDLTKQASQTDLVNACFWFGINDVQIYKDAFLGNLRETGQTKAQSQEFYIKSFVEEYCRLVKLYLESCEAFSGQENKIYLMSIVSTSTQERDYYDEQGEVISKVNECLKELAEIEQDNWLIQSSGGSYDGSNPVAGYSGSKAQSWLQYFELNVDEKGQTYENAQDFVSDSDFRDYIHFTRYWFQNKFLSAFGFSENPYDVGEGEEDVLADYSALAPKDWECSSRDITYYLQNYPRKILDWFVSQGYSAAFAIGIIANMRGESYFCPWICGDYSKDYDVSSKLWINVNGTSVPSAGTGSWFEPGGYSDPNWRSGFSRAYRTQGNARPSSFGFCQWHNTTWWINQTPPYDWVANGLVYNNVDYRVGGKQLGRGQRMMDWCINTASYKAPWSANPIGQLEFLIHELQSSYTSIWELRNIGNSMQNARHVADVFCRRFEMPPEVDARATERANRAEGYWNWLILGGPYFGG